MRAVWSFWTKPFTVHYRSFWYSERHHLFSWVLSVMTAKQHYPESVLVTDDRGAKLLIDGIGLNFDHVSTKLNALNRHDPAWWALGKMYAYRAQKEPFIHLDSDVYLWKRLPREVESAPVFAQNPEHFSDVMPYRPEEFEKVISNAGSGWLPEEWLWYRSSSLPQRGESCGIVGGTHVDFLNHYANIGINLIEEPRNQPAWAFLADKIGKNILFEQYMLSACIEYCRNKPDSPYRGIEIKYLFPTWGDAFVPANAARLGYTHLLGRTKKNQTIADRLEKKVMRVYPQYYERCINFLERNRKIWRDGSCKC